jgi:ubiquitin related modifier 1
MSVQAYFECGARWLLACVCSGGLELLFDKIKSREVELPAAVVTMKDLIAWMRETLLRERTELFVAGETV